MNMPSTPAAAPAPRTVKSKSKSRIYLVGTLAACVVAFLVVLVGSGDADGKWVLVARQTISARSTLDVDLFEARELPEEAIVAGAISGDSKEDVLEAAEKAGIDGAVAQYPLPKDGQFSTNLISAETELARPLGKDERLISVPASYAATLAGTLKVGDHVDLYAVGDQGTPVANLVLGDVEVVGVALPEDQVSSVYQAQLNAAESGEEKSPSELLPGDPIPGVFTLRVPVDRVGAIAVAAQHSDLVLTYRGGDASATPMNPVDLYTVLCSATVPAGADQAAIDALRAGMPAACQR